jgi:hypothetical protein
MTPKFDSLLGMAMRAGKVAFGSFQVESVLKKKGLSSYRCGRCLKHFKICDVGKGYGDTGFNRGE